MEDIAICSAAKDECSLPLPLVSVVVAVYNGDTTLQYLIDSVVNQTYPNKELVIIDGNSQDGTVEILRNNTHQIDYWVSEADRGIYHAWNKALKVVKGDYICFLGADDEYATTTSLQEMLDSIKEGHTPDLISAKICLIDSNRKPLSVRGEEWSWKKLLKQHCLAHPGLLHHSSVFEKTGDFNELYKIAADYDFLLRMGSNVSYKHLNKVTVLMGDGGVSNSQIFNVLNETRLMQAQHPEIGGVKALTNFIEANIRIFLTKVRALLGIKSLRFWRKNK